MMKRKIRLLLSALCICLAFCTGCDGTHDPLLIPDGGYDYTVSGGYILGYPIPLVGDNPMRINQTEEASAPPAFTYNSEYMQYFRAETAWVPLTLPNAETVSVPAVTDENGTVVTYFETALSDGGILFEGTLDGGAVLLWENALYQVKAGRVHLIGADIGAYFGISPDGTALLFTHADGTLVHYDALTQTTATLAYQGVTDAWFVRDPVRDGLSADEAILFCHKGVWHHRDAAGLVLCVPPNDSTEDMQSVYIRGTDMVLYGDNTSCFFADAVTGVSLEMDMGGLYKFHGTGTTDTLPLSPDGIFVYFYDVDFIYRLNLRTSSLDLAYNEAPMFENTCIINSMTAVTDEIVVLSQRAAEHTEFMPTVTIAVFEEDIPELRHEDDKIDLDHHTAAEGN